MQAKQVLIVDDSPVIVSRLKSLLEGLPGLDSILDAGTYADAVAILAERSPHILLLDINLPDHSGIWLLRYVAEKYPSIIVIMISNQTSEYYENICRRLGAVYFIDKSIDFDKVPAILSTFL